MRGEVDEFLSYGGELLGVSVNLISLRLNQRGFYAGALVRCPGKNLFHQSDAILRVSFCAPADELEEFLTPNLCKRLLEAQSEIMRQIDSPRSVKNTSTPHCRPERGPMRGFKTL